MRRAVSGLRRQSEEARYVSRGRAARGDRQIPAILHPPMKYTLILLSMATALLAQAPGRQKRIVSDAEVARVHRSTILIDTHNDVTSATVAGLDLGKPNTSHMTDI